MFTGHRRLLGLLSPGLVAHLSMLFFAMAQVIEGESEIVNIRETDGRLGPLVFALVALGIVTIIGTVVFWWLTRPNAREPNAIEE